MNALLLLPALSCLSTNHSKPFLLGQSERPFPLSWRDVECADVEPCNSILLNKSSRPFLGKLHTPHCWGSSEISVKKNKADKRQIGKRTLLPFSGFGWVLSSNRGGLVRLLWGGGAAVQWRPSSAEAAIWRSYPPTQPNYLPPSWLSGETELHQQVYIRANKTRQFVPGSEGLRSFKWEASFQDKAAVCSLPKSAVQHM